MPKMKGKLTAEELNFLKLLVRSKDTGDGWRRVSDLLMPMAQKYAEMRPELYEIRPSGIRMTQRAEIILEYL